jgi:hypothetical protein
MTMSSRRLFRQFLLLPLLGGSLSALAGVATFVDPGFLNPVRHGVVYRDGVLRDLGPHGGVISEAYDIDDAGHANGAMVDLDALVDSADGWQIVSAPDIERLASACGFGECSTVRLDRVSTLPEPKIWGMLLAGLALMGTRRRRAFRSETFS